MRAESGSGRAGQSSGSDHASRSVIARLVALILFDPTVDLFRWVLEPVDPQAHARTLTRERVAGPAPHLLVQLAGHDEVAAPPASESVIAAAGIIGVGEFAFADIEPAMLPLPGAGADPDAATVGAVRFDGAMRGMLEVVSQASSFEDPLVRARR